MFPLSLVNYFELGAFFLSIRVYLDLKQTSLRPFPFFLGFIVLGELVTKWSSLPAPALALISTTGFVFYAFIFSRRLRYPFLKRTASSFVVLYPLLALADWFFAARFSGQIGAVFMIFFCCCFFYELLLHPLEGLLSRDPMFWISTGILFFYLGNLSYNLLFNLLERHADPEDRKLFRNINNNLILILYSCFIIAFLCQRSPRKSSSP